MIKLCRNGQKVIQMIQVREHLHFRIPLGQVRAMVPSLPAAFLHGELSKTKGCWGGGGRGERGGGEYESAIAPS